MLILVRNASLKCKEIAFCSSLCDKIFVVFFFFFLCYSEMHRGFGESIEGFGK